MGRRHLAPSFFNFMRPHKGLPLDGCLRSLGGNKQPSSATGRSFRDAPFPHMKLAVADVN